MKSENSFDVIIVGGSYAGLSAAMSLGRALRKVLVIDSGNPCNLQTPYSHNFLTQDGQPPAQIAALARAQVAQYDTVKLHQGLALSGSKTDRGFEIGTQSGELFIGRKLIFATGLKDIMPGIKGFSDCWGISILHCPYCHGYEVRGEKTGIFANGDVAFHFAQLISNWTSELSIFTNGKPDFTPEQLEKMDTHSIRVIPQEIDHIVHEKGRLSQVVLKGHAPIDVKAVYAGPEFEQQSAIPDLLGCALTEQGLFKVDHMQKTTVPGVYACGDSSNMRAVSVAVASGTMAGAVANFELIGEDF